MGCFNDPAWKVCGWWVVGWVADTNSLGLDQQLTGAGSIFIQMMEGKLDTQKATDFALYKSQNEGMCGTPKSQYLGQSNTFESVWKPCGQIVN